MSSPVPLRPPTASLVMLLGAVVLAGCGNRGELYLEPEPGAGLETDPERLGEVAPGTAPEGGSVPGAAAEPSLTPEPDTAPAPLGTRTIVPEAGVAPSAEPALEGFARPAEGGVASEEEADGEGRRRARPAPDDPATDGTDR